MRGCAEVCTEQAGRQRGLCQLPHNLGVGPGPECLRHCRQGCWGQLDLKPGDVPQVGCNRCCGRIHPAQALFHAQMGVWLERLWSGMQHSARSTLRSQKKQFQTSLMLSCFLIAILQASSCLISSGNLSEQPVVGLLLQQQQDGQQRQPGAGGSGVDTKDECSWWWIPP